ncbi:hypothetical protein H5087_16145 [Pseudoalteromonas sp. SR43-7]|uniref:hypothetical protein n=1 Tax=Pseudoalteromonas sp. SR43-7 TaxID=2760939 RepID=UPI0015F8967B|nr:hypothetical protein [Pseudoalteromonas sp. SR43-7]MBB1330881.1 hypothetical protein [Pseudoalteromonas sp. SR43-7]
MIYSENLEGEYELLIVPFEHLETFKVAKELKMINSNSVYTLNFNATCECSIEFIGNTILKKHDSIVSIESFDLIEKYLESFRYEEAIELIKSISKRTHSQVARRFYTNLEELIKTISFFMNTVLLGSPFIHGASWVNSPFESNKVIHESFKKGAYINCSIKKIAVEKCEVLKKVFDNYENDKPNRKLEFLSAFFLFHSFIAKKNNDNTYSLLLLHRATETYILSILIDEKEISLNADGSVKGDKYHYLSDYYQMLKTIRAYGAEEDSIIKLINEYRNHSKLAHGYSYITEDDLSIVFDYLQSMILGEPSIKQSYCLLRKGLSFNHSISDMGYEFIMSESFVFNA